MSKVPLVSIIIVNFNGRNFVGECIESVLRTDYPNFEVILVDNASTDGSFDFVTNKFGNDKKVRLVKTTKQLYFTGGSNLGAIKAKGEKLLFLNSDTVVDKAWVKELISFANRHADCLVQPKILTYQDQNTIDNVGGNYSYLGFGTGGGHGEPDRDQYNQDCLVDFTNGTCFMVDRKLFFDLGGFDEWYKYHYEDVDLCLRASRQGIKSWYCRKSVIYHKGSLTVKSQLNKSDLLFNIRKNRLRTVLKNYTGWQRVIKTLGLVIVYLAQSLTSLVTLKSIFAVISFENKVAIDKFRLWELGKIVRKKCFRLLDLGCGDGNLLELALDMGIDALGVEELPRVHNKILHDRIENYKPIKTNEKYDVVSLYHVIEHLHRPADTLINIKSWLTVNGWLVIEVPLVGNLSNKFLGGKYFAYNDASHHTFFTEKELINILEQNGWKIIKKGFTLHEFPFTIITTAFRKNIFYGLLGLFLFTPLKLLTLLGLNTEIIRIYCQRK